MQLSNENEYRQFVIASLADRFAGADRHLLSLAVLRALRTRAPETNAEEFIQSVGEAMNEFQDENDCLPQAKV